MEFFDSLATYIVQLDRKKFNTYAAALLGGIFLAGCGSVYFFYNKRTTLLAQLDALYKQAEQNNKIVHSFEKVKKEEERIQTLLENNKGFSVKSFFEQFCSEHKVTPEPGWDTEVRGIEGNEQFDEVVLPATFKKQSTKELVTLLNSLEANEIVYIKELDIKKEENNTISFNLTIATKKQKRFWQD